MLRAPALRSSTWRSLIAPTTTPLRPITRVSAPQNGHNTSKLCTWSSKRPQIHAIALQKLNSTAYIRQQTTKGPVDKIDSKLEKKQGKEKLDSDPEHVTTTSSVHPVFSEIGVANPEPDADMGAGIKADLVNFTPIFPRPMG
jgi:hypothetical protein